MVNFDKFEKRVKETYGKQEFPFDEQNWEKASKMIDASRQGKNRGGIFLLSAVALLCTTGLVYYFGFSDPADALKKNNLASNELSNKELVLKPGSGETTPIENGNVNQNYNEAVNSNSSNENGNDNSVSKNTSSNLTSTSKNNVAITLTKTKNSDRSTAETAGQDLKNETKEAEKTTISSDANANETKTSTSSKTNSKKPEAVRSNSKNTTPPVLGSLNPNNQYTTAGKESPVGGTGNSDKEGNINAPTDPAKNGTVIDSSNSVALVNMTPIESIVTDSSQSINQFPVDSFKFPPAPKGDGISYATNVKMEHNHKNFLFMEAGAVYLLGWNGINGTDAGGFNLAAGLNFQHYFTNNFSAQIGVQYSTIVY